MKLEEYVRNCSLRTQRLARQILSDEFVGQSKEAIEKEIAEERRLKEKKLLKYKESFFSAILSPIIRGLELKISQLNSPEEVNKRLNDLFWKAIEEERSRRLLSTLPELGKYYSMWVGSSVREWSHSLSIYEKIESDGVVAVVLRYRDDLGVDGRKRSIRTVIVVDVDKGEKLYSWSSTPAEKYSGVQCSKDSPEEVVFEIEYIDRQLGSHDYKRIIVTHKKS